MKKVLALLSILSACASDEIDDDELVDVCFPGAKCDSFDHHGVIRTSDRMANVLSGYNPLTDRVTTPCVEPTSTPSYIAGQASESLDLVYLENRNSVTKESSTALGLNLPFMLLSVNGGFELLQKVSTKSTSINLLVRMTADYWVMNRRRVRLDGDAANKLSTSIESFAKSCGSHYADGVRYGGFVYALITIDTSDTASTESIRSKLGLNLLGVVPLSTTLSQKIVTVATSSNTTVKVHFAADGFMLDGRPASAPILATLLGEGIGPRFFEILDHIRGQLEQSVTLDKCRDSGHGTCDGVASPGYEDNTLRNARPTGIYAGYYDRARSVPSRLLPRFEEIAKRLERTETYLAGLAKLQTRVDAAAAEITKVRTSATRPYYSQVAPPGQPRLRATDLVEIANTWGAVFAPGGTATAPLRTALDACRVASTTLTECTASTDAVNETIASYVKSGRILWTNVALMIGDDVESGDAAWKCNQQGGRLPTDEEARFVAPTVGLSWFTDRRIWTSSARCAGAALRIDPAAGYAEQICVPNAIFADDELALICVKPNGPYPQDPPP